MAKEAKIEYISDDRHSFEARYKKIKKLLKECKKEKNEYLDGWQRARAELQNRVRQMEASAEEFRKFAESDILLKLLPVLDTFQMALNSTPSKIKDDTWVKGIGYIEKQIENILQESGVEEIETSIGAQFDPAMHEAVEEVASKGEGGEITEIVQKGYTLNGKILRVTKVKVTK